MNTCIYYKQKSQRPSVVANNSVLSSITLIFCFSDTFFICGYNGAASGSPPNIRPSPLPCFFLFLSNPSQPNLHTSHHPILLVLYIYTLALAFYNFFILLYPILYIEFSASTVIAVIPLTRLSDVFIFDII